MNSVIDPALLQSFPSGGELPSQSSPSAPPGLYWDPYLQTTAGDSPVTVDQTVTIQYETHDEAKHALMDAKTKTLQKLQFIERQIEDLERRKQNRNEAVRGLESVKGDFFS